MALRLKQSKGFVNEFDGNTKIYRLAKSNTMMNDGKEQYQTRRSIMYDTMTYHRRYYKRENSESGFSGDKRPNGWKVLQKGDDR